MAEVFFPSLNSLKLNQKEIPLNYVDSIYPYTGDELDVTTEVLITDVQDRYPGSAKKTHYNLGAPVKANKYFTKRFSDVQTYEEYEKTHSEAAFPPNLKSFEERNK